MEKNVWRRLGWSFLLAAILLLLASRIGMPVTPPWLDAVLLAAGALCLLVMNTLAKKQRVEPEDNLENSKTLE
ncbi:MAG: hypothetical protein L6Q60_13595 [Rhodocyclaceae bacterium]|nr:hypothetical protein [Rhodocyclaceae bacterium]